MTCGSEIFAESLGSSATELASVSYRFFLWMNRKKLLCCGKLFQFCCLICLTQVCFARSIARLQKESATVAFVVKDPVLKCFEKLHLPVIHVVFLSSPSVEWVDYGQLGSRQNPAGGAGSSDLHGRPRGQSQLRSIWMFSSSPKALPIPTRSRPSHISTHKLLRKHYMSHISKY